MEWHLIFESDIKSFERHDLLWFRFILNQPNSITYQLNKLFCFLFLFKDRKNKTKDTKLFSKKIKTILINIKRLAKIRRKFSKENLQIEILTCKMLMKLYEFRCKLLEFYLVFNNNSNKNKHWRLSKSIVESIEKNKSWFKLVWIGTIWIGLVWRKFYKLKQFQANEKWFGSRQLIYCQCTKSYSSSFKKIFNISKFIANHNKNMFTSNSIFGDWQMHSWTVQIEANKKGFQILLVHF